MSTETPQCLALADSEDTFTVTDADLGLIGGSPTVTYTVRPIPNDEIDEFRKKRRGKKEWNRTARAYEYPEFDQKGFDADMLDRAVVGWAGVMFRGEPAPCTREFKLKLDAIRQQLLVTKATMNRVTEAVAQEDAAADSFPGVAGV